MGILETESDIEKVNERISNLEQELFFNLNRLNLVITTDLEYCQAERNYWKAKYRQALFKLIKENKNGDYKQTL